MLDCWIEKKADPLEVSGKTGLYTRFFSRCRTKNFNTPLKDIDHAPDVLLAYQQEYDQLMP
jgi:hypothetical protein